MADSYDKFSGDLKITVSEDGADFKVEGGQPEMIVGVEQEALMSLFTRKGWPGNALLGKELGSDFEANLFGNMDSEYLEKLANQAAISILGGAVAAGSAEAVNFSNNDIRITVTGSAGGMNIIRENALWSAQAARG